MQTTNHHSPQTIAHGLASLGRYGDTYMVHAAEGETVIPAEILLANPKLKADLFHQMQMMGIKNPNRYVVGSALNSLNPVTGQPEFFFKKMFKAFKSILPIVGQAVVNKIAPGLGGIGTLLGSKLKGDSWGDAAKYAGITTLGDIAYHGVLNPPEGVGPWEGLKQAAARPFQAARGLFPDRWGTTANPLAQGIFGQYLPGKAGEAAETFRQSFPKTGFYPGYRTSEEITAAVPTQVTQAVSPEAGLFSGEVEAGLFSETGPNIESGIGSSGGAIPTLEEIDQLVSEGSLRAGMEVTVRGPRGEAIPFTIPAEEASSTFMDKLLSPQALAFALPAGIAYAAAKEDEKEGDLTPEEIRAQQRKGDPQQVAYQESGTADPQQRDRLLAEAGIRPAFAYQGEEGIRRLARSMGISEDAARRYIGGYGPQYVAGGGEIMGAGTGTSDSIPARLSDGEFVMTADAVRGAGNGSRDLGAARMYDLMSRFEGLR